MEIVLLTDDTNILVAKNILKHKIEKLWRCCSHGFIPTIYVKHIQTMAMTFHTRQNKNPSQIQQYRYCISIRTQILGIMSQKIQNEIVMLSH